MEAQRRDSSDYKDSFMIPIINKMNIQKRWLKRIFIKWKVKDEKIKRICLMTFLECSSAEK